MCILVHAVKQRMVQHPQPTLAWDAQEEHKGLVWLSRCRAAGPRCAVASHARCRLQLGAPQTVGRCPMTLQCWARITGGDHRWWLQVGACCRLGAPA